MKKIVTLLMALIVSFAINASEKPVTTSQSPIPRILIGTKWVYENGYQAERRTIEFISTAKVKITIEDINIWTMPDPPIIKTYDCFFNTKSNMVTIKRKSDMTIEYHWMQLRFSKGKMIECTNPNVEVVYEKL